MNSVNRKITYRLYPSVKQANRMKEMLGSHQRLYNGALEERVGAYKHSRTSIDFASQCRSLTVIREDLPEYALLNAQSEQVTLKRVDLAFQNFYRRVEEGAAQAGFPRFKSLHGYKGWGYKAHGDGWRFKIGKDFINGTLKLSGVGTLQARGRGRFRDKTSRDPGVPKTMEILHRDGLWFASVTYVTMPGMREHGEEALGVDWGTSKFLTIVNQASQVSVIANPRYLKKTQDKLEKAQKELSRKKPGSQNRQKAKAVLSTAHRRLGWKRENFLHQQSSALVKRASLIGVEDLDIKSMIKSDGQRKSGLNRSILDTAPGRFFQQLKYKAEEAGILYVEAPTRKLKPSQTCSRCRRREKKKLADRVHDCKQCGFRCDRDVNAAIVILQHAQSMQLGQELALSVEETLAEMTGDFSKHETPSISEADLGC